MTITVITVHQRDDDPGSVAVSVHADDGSVHEATPEEVATLARTLDAHATSPALPADDLVRVGRLTMAPAGYRAWVDGEELQLTAREFEVLEVLARQPGEVLTRADLLRRVWGAGPEPGRRTVDVFLMRVRAKLGPAAGQLVTVNRVGYRLDA